MSVLGYLDPASGSLIAATAAAGLAGVGVAARSMWQRQTGRFRKSGSGEAVEDNADASTEVEDPVAPAVEHAVSDDH